MKEAYEDWYAQKHPKPTPAMVEWFDAHRPADCPRCGSTRIWGHGACGSGVDRCECGHCHRTFTPVTGTAFDSFKIPPSEWMEYLLRLFEFHSYLRSFLESHPSFERALLQDWLNLFVFIWNGPADRHAKVVLFMEMAMRKRALMRYRDVMGKKTADVFG